MNIETSLNITDYPEPKEQTYFEFEIDCSCKGKAGVWANSKLEAEEKLETKDYDDAEYDDFEIESVKSVSNE